MLFLKKPNGVKKRFKSEEFPAVLSDFKTTPIRYLKGGESGELKIPNPMGGKLESGLNRNVILSHSIDETVPAGY
ncbi:MAG: hypothetical protein AB1403_14210 [Candidatus Riflebacteria bacterium]